MWFVSNGIIECHIENLQIEIGNKTPNCLRHHVWLDVSTFNKCLFTTKQRGFLLILICETSQIFVWRNKAFIFFQKSDILFLPYFSGSLFPPGSRMPCLVSVPKRQRRARTAFPSDPSCHGANPRGPRDLKP